jgi:hypothetical protein
MGAELALGASQLFEAQRWYAGAALVRQLIEVEYLLFLFAVDSEEPERWVNASDEDVRRMFSPPAMRDRSRGRFRAEEYSSHCERGGHPRLPGHVLLREHLLLVDPERRELLNPAVLGVDLAQHVERMWGHYVAAVTRYSPSNVYPDRFEMIAVLFAKWRSAGPAPPRI